MIQHRPSKKARSAAVVTLGVAAAFAVSGCVDPRAPSGPLTVDVTWVDDVAPLFAERCTSCHSSTQASGDYRLDAYCAPALPSTETCAGVLGPGTDGIPNVLVGESAASSQLLAVFEGDGQTAVDHRGYLAGSDGDRALQDRLALVKRWVVDGGAAYFLSSIHSPDFLDPQQEGFHGRDIAAADWQMNTCRSCHGSDYRGGAVGVSCVSCHRNTPEACDTCHGTGALGAPPPGLDATDPAGPHQQHLVGAATYFVAAVPCEECHHVPNTFADPSHIEANPDRRAEVFFGPRASARGSNPTWDPAAKTCTNVACHGAGLTGGTMPDPAWALDTGLGCGSCHGTPPEELPNNGGPHSLSPKCELCHLVETGTGAPFPAPDNAHHGDGVITVLDQVTAPNCEGCHTGTTAPFVPPFRDTNGDTAPADPQVGDHAGHLVPSFITAGLRCADCHVVPATVGDHAHVDPNAGAEVTFGTVATSHGLVPTYDSTARTCTNTWCHGAGIPGGQTVSPAWTDVVTLGCTSCHPAPPDIPAHQLPGGGLVTTCGTAGGGCHAKVIDANFNWTNQSLHVNGQVDIGD